MDPDIDSNRCTNCHFDADTATHTTPAAHLS
jgi:hypothetical protein